MNDREKRRLEIEAMTASLYSEPVVKHPSGAMEGVKSLNETGDRYEDETDDDDDDDVVVEPPPSSSMQQPPSSSSSSSSNSSSSKRATSSTPLNPYPAWRKELQNLPFRTKYQFLTR